MSNARVFNKVREIQRKETNEIISSRSELELPAKNKTHRIIFFLSTFLYMANATLEQNLYEANIEDVKLT